MSLSFVKSVIQIKCMIIILSLDLNAARSSAVRLCGALILAFVVTFLFKLPLTVCLILLPLNGKESVEAALMTFYDTNRLNATT